MIRLGDTLEPSPVAPAFRNSWVQFSVGSGSIGLRTNFCQATFGYGAANNLSFAAAVTSSLATTNGFACSHSLCWHNSADCTAQSKYATCAACHFSRQPQSDRESFDT